MIQSSNSEELLKILQQYPDISLEESWEGLGVFKIKSGGESLLKLIEEDHVMSVSSESQAPNTEAVVRDLNLNPNKINALQHHYPQYTGKNIRISVKEPRYDTTDIDLIGKDRPTILNSPNVDPHATEMAAIIAGHGNSSLYGRGVAVDAGLASSDFAGILPDLAADYINLGIQVQNHSYGTVIENFYGVFAQAYDQSTIDNPKLLHIFSAGNIGDQASTEGPYQGIASYANLTGNFKMAKNILVVGAVDTTMQEQTLSSRGPAYDGRIKPELVAYSMTGSSNSAALTSGVAGLLQEAHRDQQGEYADAALIKALLINSAEDVANPGPDYTTGFGNMNALQAMRALEAGHYFMGELSTGQELSFPIEVDANAVELKATLVWADPASQPDNSTALINDLDLTVQTPQNNTLLPWVLDPSPSITALSSPASRGIDRLNNIEQVTVDNPSAGTYQLNAKGFDLASSSQQFYIVYQVKYADSFEWTYPTKNDIAPFNGETTGYLRWEHSMEGTADLSYRIIGEPWQVIYRNRPMDRYPAYRWVAPDTTAWAQVKMEIGEQTFISDTFRISRRNRLRVGFNCDDSLRLRWTPEPGVQEYGVYTLMDNKMAQIANVSDTSFIVRKSEYPSTYFRVRSQKDGWPWVGSDAINYEFQGGTCYLQFFFAINTTGTSIELNTTLSDVVGVEKVIFERENEDGSFQSIAEVEVGQEFEVITEDLNPKDGTNVYRSRVILESGGVLTSETSEAFILVDSPYRVFPNPVSKDQLLRVFSQTPEQVPDRIVLYDNVGRTVWESVVFSESAFFELSPNIKPGLYFYQLEQDGNPILREKLIIK